MIKGVKFVSVPVSRPGRSPELYTTRLGFEVITDSSLNGTQRGIELGVPRADTELVLFNAPGQDAWIGRFTKVTFMTDDVEATARELTAKGVEFVQGSVNEESGNRVIEIHNTQSNYSITNYPITRCSRQRRFLLKNSSVRCHASFAAASS